MKIKNKVMKSSDFEVQYSNDPTDWTLDDSCGVLYMDNSILSKDKYGLLSHWYVIMRLLLSDNFELWRKSEVWI